MMQFYQAQGMYRNTLKAYVLGRGGFVECAQTEFSDWNMKRVKYKSLFIKDENLNVKFLVRPENGDWNEYENPIEYFSMDELLHITNDIIYKE